MPAARALAIGLVNALASTTVVAMPGELAAIAELMALTMVGTVGCVDVAPVHTGVGRPSSAAASWKPYWVGVKNELSVTWLTNVNFHFGVEGKSPGPPLPLLVAPVLVPDELQAVSSAVAAADALKSPVPASSRRRVGPSFMLSVWIASSTLGSIFFITDLQGLAPWARAGPCPTTSRLASGYAVPRRHFAAESTGGEWIRHTGRARSDGRGGGAVRERRTCGCDRADGGDPSGPRGAEILRESVSPTSVTGRGRPRGE